MTEPKQCCYCGGLGHTSAHCPLRDVDQNGGASLWTCCLMLYGGFVIGLLAATAGCTW